MPDFIFASIFVFSHVRTRARVFKYIVGACACTQIFQKDFAHIVLCVEQNSQHIVGPIGKSKITDKIHKLYK